MVSLHVHSSGLVSAIENVHGNTIDRILMPNRDLGPRTDQACSSLGGDTLHTEYESEAITKRKYKYRGTNKQKLVLVVMVELRDGSDGSPVQWKREESKAADNAKVG